MQGQRGWRELAVLGDKMNKFSGMIEGFIWSPRSNDTNNQPDIWPLEDVNFSICFNLSYILVWLLLYSLED